MTTPVLNKEGLEKAREAFYAATTVLPTGTIRDLDAGVSAYLSASCLQMWLELWQI